MYTTDEKATLGTEAYEEPHTHGVLVDDREFSMTFLLVAVLGYKLSRLCRVGFPSTKRCGVGDDCGSHAAVRGSLVGIVVLLAFWLR